MIRAGTMRTDFAAAIADRVLVCDGAMGTVLYGRGAFVNRPFDELNLTDPELVASVHQAYADAGAEVIETNTFGANRQKLASFGLEGQLAGINRAGVSLARAAAGERAYVAGALGPLGGPAASGEAARALREQADVLAGAGVDLFMLETFRSVEELSAAVATVRAAADLPVVAQMTTVAEGTAPDGTAPEDFARRLVAAGATVVGVNCGCGPVAMLETVRRLAAAVKVPLAAQPNAGAPRFVEGRTMYMATPAYLASYAHRFGAAGARLVGGCCGTTPEHIRTIAERISAPR